MNERWLPVVGFEDLYEVSDLGQVRSLGRIDTRGRRRGPKLLTPSPDDKGYLNVCLTPSSQEGDTQRQVTRRVHALVLEAFAGPCPGGLEACHGNDVPDDNRLVNLRWDTRSSNHQDRIRLRTGLTAGRSRKTPVQADGVCRREHRVVAPNVARRADGRARCLACKRGHNTVKDARARGIELDVATEADRHYARIMASAVA